MASLNPVSIHSGAIRSGAIRFGAVRTTSCTNGRVFHATLTLDGPEANALGAREISFLAPSHVSPRFFIERDNSLKSLERLVDNTPTGIHLLTTLTDILCKLPGDDQETTIDLSERPPAPQTTSKALKEKLLTALREFINLEIVLPAEIVQPLFKTIDATLKTLGGKPTSQS